MIRSIIRFFKNLIFVSVFIAVVLFGISYYVTKEMTKRTVYAHERMERMKTVRAHLEKEYGAQPVQFKTKDGLNLAGLLVLREGAQRTIMLCHGYRGQKEQLRSFIKMFPSDNILLFDFRAHGQSEGTFTSIGYCEKDDVHAAVQFLQQHPHTKHVPISGFGISMGASSLIHAASQGAPFEALILDSSFSRLQDQIEDSFVARSGLPEFPILPIALKLFWWFTGVDMSEHNPCEQIKHVTCPVFIIHSKDDALMNVKHAHTLYKHAQKKKQLWIVDSALHGRACLDCWDEYTTRVNDFLAAAAV